MANNPYTSGYSGVQIDAILSLFHNKGLSGVNGVVRRNNDGTFSYQAIDSAVSASSTNPIQNQAVHSALSDVVTTITAEIPAIYFDTTAHWNAQPLLKSEENALYIYTDYKTVDNKNVPGLKIGDGVAPLIDIAFMDVMLQNHLVDSTVHVTSTERNNWNNKVRCYYSLTDPETVVFTTN